MTSFVENDSLSSEEFNLLCTQVARQGDGAEDVRRLYSAYIWTRENWSTPLVDILLVIAPIIKPFNVDYRGQEVQFASGKSALPANQVTSAMRRFLIDFQDGLMTPKEAYVEFETIHPFLDGNGRIGWLVFLIRHAHAVGEWTLLDSPEVEW